MREASLAGYPLPPLPGLDYEGNGVDDAMRMAAAIHAMAMMLVWLCQTAPHLRRRRLRRKFAGRRMTEPRPGDIAEPVARKLSGFGFRALDSPPVANDERGRGLYTS